MIGIHSEVSSIASHGRGDGTLLVLVTEAYAHNENQYTAQIISPKPVSVIDSNIFQLYQSDISSGSVVSMHGISSGSVVSMHGISSGSVVSMHGISSGSVVSMHGISSVSVTCSSCYEIQKEH